MEAIVINKQQYLAELEKLLSFMSSWDREEQMKKYSSLFENCVDEQELIQVLGTPTKVAIGIARTYVPSEPPAYTPVVESVEETPAEEEKTETEKFIDEVVKAEESEAEIPAQKEAEPQEEETPTPVAENAPVSEEVVVGAVFEQTNAVEKEEKVNLGLEEPEEEEVVPEKTRKVRVIPAILYTIIAIIIGVPIAVVLLAIGLVFVAVGVSVIAIAVLVVKAIFGAIVMVADIIMLCGAGLIVGALGLLVLWFGLWLCVSFMHGWIGTCLVGLGRKICIKEVR